MGKELEKRIIIRSIMYILTFTHAKKKLLKTRHIYL